MRRFFRRLARRLGNKHDWRSVERSLGLEPGDVQVELQLEDGHAVYGTPAAIAVMRAKLTRLDRLDTDRYFDRGEWRYNLPPGA
jgi:malate synthase